MKVASKRLESELFSISLRIEHAKADTGETCTASCTEGYVGGAQELVCQGDGQLAGSIPSCIDVARYTQISVYVLAGGMLLVLGCVYSCVCMVGKASAEPQRALARTRAYQLVCQVLASHIRTGAA
eukprot:g23668.t1